MIEQPLQQYCAEIADAILTDSTGSSDQSFIAKSIIQIGKQVYRKLNKEKQYLFTEIQNHEIWSSPSFWIEYFYEKHQIKLVTHYKSKTDETLDFSTNGEMLKTAADQLSMWDAKSESMEKKRFFARVIFIFLK